MVLIFGSGTNSTRIRRINERGTNLRVLSLAENIGDGVLIHQIKCDLPHGLFEYCIESTIGEQISARTARRHFQLAARFYKSEAAVEFAALPVEEQQAQMNGEADDSVFIAAVKRFLTMD